MKKRLEIRYIKTDAFYGLAFPEFESLIINSLIKKYPSLHTHILDHEKEHIQIFKKGGHSSLIRDIALDLGSEFESIYDDKIREDIKKYKSEHKIKLRSQIYWALYNMRVILFPSVWIIAHLSRLFRKLTEV